jgi:hypothetical protein
MLVGIPFPISQDDTRIRRCDAGSEATREEKHAVGAGAQFLMTSSDTALAVLFAVSLCWMRVLNVFVVYTRRPVINT